MTEFSILRLSGITSSATADHNAREIRTCTAGSNFVSALFPALAQKSSQPPTLVGTMSGSFIFIFILQYHCTAHRS
jgi:hypothetical protein